MMPDLTDAWRAFAREPTEERFHPLYEGTKRLVWTLSTRILRDPADASDAFQSAYARLLEEMREPARAEPPADLVGFICRLAIREADRIRKRRVRRGSRETPLRGDEAMNHEVPVDEAASRREVRDRVDALVGLLPERYRLPVQLHFFHGLSQREVAAALGKPLATVSDRIRRALGKLETAFRKAGLGRPAATLGAMGMAGALLDPPLHASAVFAHAKASAAAGAASSLQASFTASTAIAGAMTLMKAKLVPLAISIVFLALGAGIVHRSLRQDLPGPADSGPAPTVAVESAPAIPPAADPAAASTASAASEPVALTAPASAIAGRVVDSVSGEPLPGAVVRAGELETRAGEDGTYILAVEKGVHALEAVAEGHAERPAQVSHPGTGESVQDFALDPAFGVTVTVLEEDGSPIEGARVLKSAPESDGIFRGGHRREALTDIGGRAAIEGVSRIHPQRLLVEKDGYEHAYAKPEASADGADLRVVLRRIRETERAIVGHVRDARGSPIAGAVIEWKDGQGTSFGEGVRYGQFRAETDRNGRYELIYPDDYDRCDLGVAAAGYAPLVRRGVRPGRPGDPLVLDFTLEDGHWLRGRVVDEDGKPLARARVRVMPELDLLNAAAAYPAIVRETRTDAEGRFALEDLPGPTAALNLRCDCRAPEREEEVEVDREVDLVIKAHGVIRGVVVDARSGEPVSAFRVRIPEAWASDTAFTASDGRFEIGNLGRERPLGVVVEAEGYAPLEVKDVAPEPASRAPEHRFPLARGSVVEGVVVDAMTGAPLVGIQVSTTSDERIRDVPAVAWRSHREVFGVRDFMTGPDGAFRLVEGKPGRILLRGKGRRMRVIDPPERDALRGPDGRLTIAVDPGETLRGSVRLAGKEVRSVRVTLEALDADGKPSPKPVDFVETGASGEFGWDEIGPGRYRVSIERELVEPRPEFRVTISKDVTVVAGEVASADLGAGLGEITVRGSITGLEDHITQYAKVRIAPAGDPDGERLAFETYRTRDWRFACPHLKPGRYAVEVSWYEKEGERTASLPEIEVGGDAEMRLEVDPRK